LIKNEITILNISFSFPQFIFVSIEYHEVTFGRLRWYNHVENGFNNFLSTLLTREKERERERERERKRERG